MCGIESQKVLRGNQTNASKEKDEEKEKTKERENGRCNSFRIALQADFDLFLLFLLFLVQLRNSQQE